MKQFNQFNFKSYDEDFDDDSTDEEEPDTDYGDD